MPFCEYYIVVINLSSLHYSIGQLRSLQILNIDHNASLTTLPESLFRISSLIHFGCDDCEALTSPPYAVCKQGVSAVKKYIFDLKVEAGRNQHVIPVTVIGKSKAGKTSLVRSVQQNKRVLTERRTTAGKLDEATKVFKVCEAEIDATSKLLFVDYGGQSIYHFSYQLTFKTQSVPLLVISIDDFDRLAALNGEEAACREVCVDWLAHLYISSPRLCRPVVVLTHCDKLSRECIDRRKLQLVSETEMIRCRIVEAEKRAAPTSSPVFEMTSFADTSTPLITTSAIIDFSESSTKSDIDVLKQALVRIGSHLETEIPGSWYRILLDLMEETEKFFIPLLEIDKKYPEDKEHVTLQYLHGIGRTMWFSKMDALRDFVFHRPEVLTGLIEVLYSHTQSDTWAKRLCEFIPFQHHGETVEKGKYEEMVETFTTTGVMEAPLLVNLLEKESNLPTTVAIEVLKTFHLLHLSGSSSQTCQQRYIIPYFATRILAAPSVYSDLLPLKVDVQFYGLPLPSYVYSLMTAAYLDINSNPYCLPEVGTNGATISQGNGIVNFFTHSVHDRRVTLVSLSPSKKTHEAWMGQLKSVKQLVAELKSLWKAVRYETIFYCSHCLLMRRASPAKRVDPDWGKPSGENTEDSVLPMCYTGEENFLCKNDPDRQPVPNPLMFPCEYVAYFGANYS